MRSQLDTCINQADACANTKGVSARISASCMSCKECQSAGHWWRHCDCNSACNTRMVHLLQQPTTVHKTSLNTHHQQHHMMLHAVDGPYTDETMPWSTVCQAANLHQNCNKPVLPKSNCKRNCNATASAAPRSQETVDTIHSIRW
jgi:hypothetical protein